MDVRPYTAVLFIGGRFDILFNVAKKRTVWYHSLMVIRMRHTKSKRNRVRSHHALKQARFNVCGQCGTSVTPHIVCQKCGYYRDRKVIDVLAKLDKKDRKKKEKELTKQE